MRPTVCCVLCRRSEQTKLTGPLSTKDEVTAHQNCLFFASGLYSEDSPQFDNLFGFSVADVLEEVRRGRKLKCSLCKLSGATAGCEVGLCKKCYHYPCAVEDNAHIIEEPEKESYKLFCSKHHESNSSRALNKPSTSTSRASKSPREATSSKEYCFACERTEGSIPLENLSDKFVLYYCDRHAPSSHKQISKGGSAGPSSTSSDSSSCSKLNSSKRRLSSSDNEEETPTKQRRSTSNIFPHSDEDDSNTDIYIFAPLEESPNSAPLTVPQFSRRLTDSPAASPPGNHLEEEEEESREEEELIDVSDAESESLLAPLKTYMDSRSLPHVDNVAPTSPSSMVKYSNPGPSSTSGPHRTSTPNPSGPEPSQSHPVGSSPSGSRRDARRPPTEQQSSSRRSSSHPDPSSSSSPSPWASELNLDSVSFWKSCNKAGCTQAIFTQFSNQMNDIASKIQCEQASQEDYDRALAVMAASGRLSDIMSQQQEELRKKQDDFQKAAAMMDVVKGLRKHR